MDVKLLYIISYNVIVRNIVIICMNIIFIVHLVGYQKQSSCLYVSFKSV